MDNNTVAIAAISLAGAICTGFFTLVNKQNKTHERIAIALDRNTQSNQEIAKETRQGNEEAKERNGHLADLVIESKQQTIEAIKPVQTIKEQHIGTQVIGETQVLPDRRKSDLKRV